MNPCRDVLTLAATLGLFSASFCDAQIILDQSQTSWSGSPRAQGNTSLAETFTAGVSGTLAHLDLWLARANAGETNAFLISITDTQGGVPGNQLGFASLTSVHGDYYEWYSIDFLGQSVHLSANHQYALVLSCPGSFNGVLVGASVDDTYTRGEGMERTGVGAWEPITLIHDLEFQTFMVVPEPGPGILALLGTLVWVYSKRRTR